MKASGNAKKIADMLAASEGQAALYRTIEAGPSGQRADLYIATVRYQPNGPDDFRIYVDRDLAGYARWMPDCSGHPWSIWRERYDGGIEWVGYASSLAVGCDVLINGEHAALGRHDSRRISSGSLKKTSGRHYEQGVSS